MRLLAIEDINVVLLVRERLSGLNSVEAHLGAGGMSDSRRVGMRIKDGDPKRVKFAAEPCAHDPAGLFFSRHHQETLSEFCFFGTEIPAVFIRLTSPGKL